MPRKDWILTLGLIILGGGLFGLGFFLGYKTVKPATGEVKGAQVVVEKKVDAQAVPGVFWIKAGGQPVCPDSHPIKGKFDNYTGYFYATDYKTYDKIKPVLCFASEEYAAKEGGFLKKY
jgi:hypothetical protein